MRESRELYLNPCQSTTRQPSDWENELADAIEAAFSEECWGLEALVERLNRSRVRGQDGQMWTPETFVHAMRELAV